MTADQVSPREESNSITSTRLQLLANGWTPLPNFDKRNFMKGWPTVTVDEDEIRLWGRRHRRFAATGIRVENGLAVVDVDVDDPALVEAVIAAMEAAAPDIVQCSLRRTGKGAKVALFIRTEELFSRIHTRRWRPKGASGDADTFCVEIFGGASPRQFGAFGPHSVDEAGRVKVSYGWDDFGSPATVPLAELPALPKSDFHAAADAAETAMRAAGLEPVPNSTSGENDATRLYDITDDMQFDLADGRRVSLPELRQCAAEDEGLRCSASWLEGEQAKRRDRCLVSLDRSGGVCIWETSSGVTHCEKSREPRDFELEMDRVAEKLKELDERRRNRLNTRDSAVVTATKLTELYAFCPHAQLNVVPLWTDTLDDGMTLGNFRTMMVPYAEEEIGPRGGRKLINPVDIWTGASKRRTVAGLRMRPDQPRPTYEDRGRLWVNTYDPPTHDEPGGDASPAQRFMQNLLPDAEERDWFLKWLAHKFRWPHLPGVAVVMVAREYGTGRGTLGALMGKLFGDRYVKSVPFHMFAGKSYQSQYNDWGADALVAFVAESSETDGAASTFQTKRNTYEHLKELVEPSAKERQFIRKGDRNFWALSFTSYIIATNNPDALPIPENDRRFTVLSNHGEARPQAYWDELYEWMERPENVAAVAAWLRSIDLTGFSPMRPLMTEAKGAMTEFSRSDLDRGFDVALSNIVGEVFVPEQVVELMRQAAATDGLDYPDRWPALAKKLVQSRCHRVGVRHGANWMPMIESRRYAVYALTQVGARKWRDRDRLREEVLKSGSPAGSGLPGNVLSAAFKR